MSAKVLPLYLNELTFHFNNRKTKDILRVPRQKIAEPESQVLPQQKARVARFN